MAKHFKIVTLGCRTNQYESEAFRNQLEQMGYTEVLEGTAADLCIVNTCTVTANADKDSLSSIRQLKKKYPDSRIVVTGCATEAHKDLVDKYPEIWKVVGNLEKEQLIAQVFPDEEVPEFSIRTFDAHTRAFVKVQDGCNSFCTYCIIPYVRGRSRSRTIADIVKEVQELVANGYQEIVLTGINIGDFDGGEKDAPYRLAQLVRAVDAIEGIKRLRLSSIDPDEVDDELASAILQGKNTAPSLHLVLQSGSNAILKRMNRKYTRQIFLETVERLKALCPDFAFTTDVIVGFPGETEEDFKETLEIIQEVEFAKIHMFPYSERPRTRAAQYPNKVSKEVMQERKTRLLQEAERVAYSLREKYVGRRLHVLCEHREEGASRIFGHTGNFLGVWIEEPSLVANQMVLVEMIANTPEGLIGRVVEGV